MTFVCVAIKTDSVSVFKFTIFSHVRVMWRVIFQLYRLIKIIFPSMQVFTTPALTDSFSLKSEYQQIFSAFQGSSMYFNSTVVSMVFILPLISSFPSFFGDLWRPLQSFNYNWYHHYLHVPQFFFPSALARSMYYYY